jgi:hypothetical protein
MKDRAEQRREELSQCLLQGFVLHYGCVLLEMDHRFHGDYSR